MSLLWMTYFAAVAALLGLSGLAVEHALRSRGYPARGVWLSTLLLSWVMPVYAWIRPPAQPAPIDAFPVPAGGWDGVPVSVGPFGIGDGMMTWASTSNPYLTWLVVAVGALAITVLLLSLTRLTRRVRRWPTREVEGQGVTVSRDFGPVVVGVAKPRIVLPSWVLALSALQQRLIVRHEHEHRMGRDPVLLTLGALAVMGAPWNPALWWQMRRFRLATELDCDRRVVAGGASPRQYGELLLDVGRRQVGDAWPLAALAEPPSFLERRLRMIARRGKNDGRWKTALLAAGATVLLVGACETPVPPLTEEINEQEVVAGEITLTERASDEQAPLIIVDGVITSMDLDALDPDDIESVEVIKEGAALALYGERAANGVVQITTKENVRVEAARRVQELARRTLEEKIEAGESRFGTITEKLDVASDEAQLRVEALRRTLEQVGGGGDGVELDRKELEQRLQGELRRLDELTEELKTREGGLELVEVQQEIEGSVSTLRLSPTNPSEGPAPLIYVDGVRIEGDINELRENGTLDPESIDRIEVIKGDAALKGYGEAAAGGVIQIFTKRD